MKHRAWVVPRIVLMATLGSLGCEPTADPATPTLEAPTLETPTLEAPLEAPTLEAPLEAPTLEAPLEAPTLEAPLEAPVLGTVSMAPTTTPDDVAPEELEGGPTVRRTVRFELGGFERIGAFAETGITPDVVRRVVRRRVGGMRACAEVVGGGTLGASTLRVTTDPSGTITGVEIVSRSEGFDRTAECLRDLLASTPLPPNPRPSATDDRPRRFEVTVTVTETPSE